MSDDEKWGPGPKQSWRMVDEKIVVGTGAIGFDRRRDQATLQLLHGKHPHGRNYNNWYATADKRDPEPVAFDGHRFRTYLEIEELNYYKASSLTGTEIRKYAELRVFMDDEHGKRNLVYVKGHRDLAPLMHWWLANDYKFSEDGVVQLFRASELKELPGMEVWWNGQPAVAVSWDPRRYLTIRATSEEGFLLPFPSGDSEPCMTYDGLDPWDVFRRK